MWVNICSSAQIFGLNLEISRKMIDHFLSCAARAHSFPHLSALASVRAIHPKSILVLSFGLPLHDIRAIVQMSGRRVPYRSIGRLEWLRVITQYYIRRTIGFPRHSSILLFPIFQTILSLSTLSPAVLATGLFLLQPIQQPFFTNITMDKVGFPYIV